MITYIDELTNVDFWSISPFLAGLAALLVSAWALRWYSRRQGARAMQWVDNEAAQQFREIGEKLGKSERPEFVRRVVAEAVFNVIDELAERKILTDAEAAQAVEDIGKGKKFPELLPINFQQHLLRQPLSRRQQNKLINAIKRRLALALLFPAPKLPDGKEVTPKKQLFTKKRRAQVS